MKAVIFDCDGVLFASEGANLAFYNHIFSVFGMPPVSPADKMRLRVLHTYSSHQVFIHFFGTGRLYDEVLTYACTVDYRRFVPLMIPHHGLFEVLDACSRQYPLAIATNRRGSMSLVADYFGIGGYFSHILTAADVPRPKPAPDMLEEIIGRLGILPAEALYVGDSVLDRDAARDAGIPFLGFGSAAGATRRIDCLTELLPLAG
ncbi:MAG: HAD family hydrolase [Deltaproteobacteria bacterium]|nr:HAD family hydrolase [Candidatus Anaeroferrophillacea bacterium]